jgi:tetratricopeptide (TPR) repeat protein
MARRRIINWKFILVILIAFGVLAAVAVGLRNWNRQNKSSQGMTEGLLAYDEARWDVAASRLSWYVYNTEDTPEKIPIILKFAESLMNTRPRSASELKDAVNAYKKIVRVEEDHGVPPESLSVAAEQLMELLILLNETTEAEKLGEKLLGWHSSLKVRRLHALVLAETDQPDRARQLLVDQIEQHADDIESYELLGRMNQQYAEAFEVQPRDWFDLAIEKNPDNALAYIARADFYADRKDMESSRTDMRKADRCENGGEPIALLKLANISHKCGDFMAARSYLDKAYVLEPENQVLWELKAKLSLAARDLEEMKVVAREGLVHQEKHRWDFMPTAIDLLIKADELAEAGAHVDQMHEEGIMPALANWFDGLIAEKQKNYEAALVHLDQAHQSGYRNPRLHLAIGRIAVKLNRVQQAIDNYREASVAYPTYIPTRMALANLMRRYGNWEGVEEQARIVLQHHPEHLKAHLFSIEAGMKRLVRMSMESDSRLWNVLEERLKALDQSTDGQINVQLLAVQMAILRERWDEADGVLEKLENRHPDASDVLVARINYHSHRNEEKQAEAKMLEGYLAYPQNQVFTDRLVAHYLEREDHGQARSILEESIERFSDPAESRNMSLMLVQLYYRTGDSAAALQTLQSAIEKFPKDVALKAQLLNFTQINEKPEDVARLIKEIKEQEGAEGVRWRYEQARAWFHSGDLAVKKAEIVELLNDILKKNPYDVHAALLLGRVYERTNQWAIAVLTYQTAMDRLPNSPTVISAYVNALIRTEDYDKADAILRQAADRKLQLPELDKLQILSQINRGSDASLLHHFEEWMAKHPDDQGMALLYAKVLMEDGEDDKAMALLQTWQTKNPNALAVAQLNVALLVKQNRLDEALTLCNEFVESTGKGAAYLLRAKVWMVLQEKDNVLADFDSAIQADPEHTHGYVVRSRFFQAQGDYDRAIADIERALEFNGENIQIVIQAVNLYMAAGDKKNFDTGRTLLDASLADHPDDSLLLFTKANELLVRNNKPDTSRAIKHLQLIIEQDPDLAPAWIVLGNVYLDQDHAEDALHVALRGLAKFPKNKDLFLIKAEAEAIHAPSFAISTLKTVRELDPEDTKVVLRLVDLYIVKKQYDKGLALLEDELARCSDPEKHKQLSLAQVSVLYESGQPEQAKSVLKPYEEAVLNDPPVFRMHARVLMDEKQWAELFALIEQWCKTNPSRMGDAHYFANRMIWNPDAQAKVTAEKVLKVILETDPENVLALADLATYHQNQGQIPQAMRTLQKILEFDGENVMAMNNLAWLLTEYQEEHRNALAWADKGLEISPLYADLIDTRGVIHHRLGQFDQASQDFELCLELYPLSHPAVATVHLHLAKTLLELKNDSLAADHLHKASQLHKRRPSLSAEDARELHQLSQRLQVSAL